MDISKIFQGKSVDGRLNLPLYMQLVNIISYEIKQGNISPGCKLPPERELATIFGVSRTTAISAYRQLEQQGLVVTKVGSGTYVAEQSDDSGMPQLVWNRLFVPQAGSKMSSILKELVSESSHDGGVSLAAGMPDPRLYPLVDFKMLLDQNIHGINNADLGYISTEGYEPLRRLVGNMLKNKGIEVKQEEILITAGSQQAIYLASEIFLSPGDYAIVESPGYIGAIQIFRNAGVRVLSLPLTGDSLGVLEDYLIRYRPKILYTVPTYHNPTGRTSSLEERRQLLRLAARYQLVIIEDDPYSEIYFGQRPPLALKASAEYPGVIYIGTFSKILMPGLRIGWVAASPQVISRMALEKQFVDLHCGNISQWLLYLYLAEGKLDGHVRKIREEYKRRRDVLVSGLRRHCSRYFTFEEPEGGFYLWLKITAGFDSQVLLREAVEAGITFVPGEAFYSESSGDKELRLCYATHDENELNYAVKKLAEVCSKLQKEYSGRRQRSAEIGTRPIV